MKNTSKLIDKRLVEAYQSGDKNSLNTLVERWHLNFCKISYLIVKDADIAKDIAQESWKTIFLKLNDLKDSEKFGSWAISIVNRKSIDFLRGNKRVLQRKEDYQREVKKEELLCENEEPIIDEGKLKSVITQLPENQQIIIKLFYVQEYTLKEIAELLNISVGTAKSRLFHAREKIKMNLKQ